MTPKRTTRLLQALWHYPLFKSTLEGSSLILIPFTCGALAFISILVALVWIHQALDIEPLLYAYSFYLAIRLVFSRKKILEKCTQRLQTLLQQSVVFIFFG